MTSMFRTLLAIVKTPASTAFLRRATAPTQAWRTGVKSKVRTLRRNIGVCALALAAILSPLSIAHADETNPRQILQAMSDYLAAQDRIAFDYDTTRDIVTTEDQKLGLASSGSVTLARPDRLRATRNTGFAQIEMVFDGARLTVHGKGANLFTGFAFEGSIDQLIDALRDEYGIPVPAADLLLSNPYEELMREVYDVKDLGIGVVGGVVCDSLAFRADEVDWQIWIAQGDRPYPCRYVITSKQVAGAPQHTVEVRNWRSGAEVAGDDFVLAIPAGATEIAIEDLRDKVRDLPQHFSLGEAQ